MSNTNILLNTPVQPDEADQDLSLPAQLLKGIQNQEATQTAKTDKAFLKKASKALRTSKKDAAPLGPPKVVNMLRKALNHYHNAEFPETLRLTLEATELYPESALGYHMMAMSLEKLGATHKALLMYEKTLQLDPNEFDVYLNLGTTAKSLGMEDAAEKFYRIYIDLEPNKHHGYNDLGGLLRDQNRFDDAIELVRYALNHHPESAELWNTMGTIAGETQQIDQAITFYKEAMRLDPGFFRALYNMANLSFSHGHIPEALEGFEEFLRNIPENHPDALEVKHARSMALLGLGRLEEGWRAYQVRNKPLFRASSLFAVDAPFWNGEDLRGKNILVIGEQGVGDEILFANPMRDLIEQVGPTGNVLISVTPRLVPLFKRAYPECHVEAPVFSRHNGKLVHLTPWHDTRGKLDYFAPMADLAIFLRTTAASYRCKEPVIVPDPEEVQDWKTRLAEISDGPFVGVCWRSGLMTAGRQKFYAPIDLWRPILEKKNVTFINLQYGDVDDEIGEIEQRFGTRIHQMDGLDIKNNLDGNAALCSALDMVVSAATAASAIAGGVGTETWILLPKNSWVLLGDEDYQWYPKSRAFALEEFGDWEGAIHRMSTAMDEWIDHKI